MEFEVVPSVPYIASVLVVGLVLWRVFVRMLAGMESRFDDWFRRIDDRFKQIDTRFGQMETRFEDRFKQMENQFDTRFVSLEKTGQALRDGTSPSPTNDSASVQRPVGNVAPQLT